MREYQYTTPHGIQVTRTLSKGNYRRGLKHLLRDLDSRRGIYLSSGYEYPGRYSRWDFGSVCPPLEIVAWDRRIEFRPLNERGKRIAQMFHAVLADHPDWESFSVADGVLHPCRTDFRGKPGVTSPNQDAYTQAVWPDIF